MGARARSIGERLLERASCVGLLASVAFGGASGATVAGAENVRHPQDGPDVDLRIEVDETGAHVKLRMNLAFVDEVVDVAREDEAFLHRVEYAAVQSALLEQIIRDHEIRINGAAIEPVLRGFDVDPPNVDLLPLFPKSGARALWQVQLDLEYPTQVPPAELRIRWGSYPPDLAIAPRAEAPPIDVVGYLRAAGVETRLLFRSDAPEAHWTAPASGLDAERFLDVPNPAEVAPSGVERLGAWFALTALLLAAGVAWRTRGALRVVAVAILLAAGGAAYAYQPSPTSSKLAWPPSEAEVLSAFEPLHANVYRAFDFTSEDEIYAALERGVEGELLEDLYLEIYSGLVLQEEGGLIARVEAVEPIASKLVRTADDPPQAVVEHDWRVRAALRHWGHGHLRNNRYQAQFTLEPRTGGWRITSSVRLGQERETLTPGEGEDL